LHTKFIEKIGKNVRRLRKQRGLTMADLAAKLNKDYQNLQRIELGTTNPTIIYLKEIADALEVDICELFK